MLSAVRVLDVITPYKSDSEQANFVNNIIFDQPSDFEMDQSSNIPMDQGDQRQDEQDLGQDGQVSETQQSPSPGPSQHNGDATSEYTTHTYETPTSNRHISATQYADRRMQVTRDRFQVLNPTMRFHSWIYGLHAYYNMGDDFYINVFAQVELEERRSRQNRPQAVQATVSVSNPNPVTSVVTTAPAATPVATAANFIPTLTSYVPYRGPFYGGSYVPTFAQPVVRPTWAAVASAAPRPAVVPTATVVRAPLVSAAGRGPSPPPPPPPGPSTSARRDAQDDSESEDGSEVPDDSETQDRSRMPPPPVPQTLKVVIPDIGRKLRHARPISSQDGDTVLEQLHQSLHLNDEVSLTSTHRSDFSWKPRTNRYYCGGQRRKRRVHITKNKGKGNSKSKSKVNKGKRSDMDKYKDTAKN